ncbi:hypothetical protein L484_025731 [Morus notabilis]|uniref:Uncharacterized protein n=1 Tax=Morus notabilis TaxID=981085 RepID=W9R3P9_9ROSA|nr:hypothetical protein L484_025731 [Morus notabilis]
MFEEEISGEFLDGEDVDEEDVSQELLKRHRFDDLLRGEDRGAKDDNLRVLLAEVVDVGDKGGAEGLGRPQEWSEGEWARTVWPCRMNARARNLPKFPNPITAILRELGFSKWALGWASWWSWDFGNGLWNRPRGGCEGIGRVVRGSDT